MIGKLLRSEIAQRKLIISVAEHLNFVQVLSIDLLSSAVRAAYAALGDL